MFSLEYFQKEMRQNKWWNKNQKVLIAVSGGADSMALFHLIRTLPEENRPKILVAHINHQLRKESDKEEEFVGNQCARYNIPFFSMTWQRGKKIKQNIEQVARSFRYHCFETIMKEQNVDILVTAHHQDDQVETVLMRLINGNRLRTLTGIKEMRETSFGTIIRPLLHTKKSDIYLFMAKNKYMYYEDASNKESTYFRNRVRNDLLPQMKIENNQIDAHLIEFQEELSSTLTLIDQFITPLYDECTTFFENHCEINVWLWQTYSRDVQHALANKLVYYLQEVFHLPISKKTQQLLEKILSTDYSNQSLSLKKGWNLKKNYQQAIISKNKVFDNQPTTQFLLKLNQNVFLSETECLAYYEGNSYNPPKEIENWQKEELPINLFCGETLLIRKKKPGDRFVINALGQTKKISRYFIDEKIPFSKREKSWIIADQNQNIKWLLPFRGSYLSIRNETDKIYGRLVYYHN